MDILTAPAIIFNVNGNTVTALERIEDGSSNYLSAISLQENDKSDRENLAIFMKTSSIKNVMNTVGVFIMRSANQSEFYVEDSESREITMINAGKLKNEPVHFDLVCQLGKYFFAGKKIYMTKA